MAGVALGDMDLHFAWQAWHLRHWAGTGDALGSGWVAAGRRTLCVAGVDMDLHFTWQAWHLVTWTFTLRGRRGTYGTGLVLVTRWGAAGLRLVAALCVAGVALSDMDLHFAWQAWHLVTWTLCVAGVALTALGDALGSGWVAAGRRTLCVAGVALSDMDLHFAWQAWHLVTWTVTLRGRRGTYGTGLELVTRWGLCGWVAAGRRTLCVAGVALSDMDLHFAWQAWHLVTWTVTLRGRRGTYGTGWQAWHLVTRWGPAGLRLVAAHFAWQAWHFLTWTFTLRGRRGTW